jgi:hypothetical protein
MSRKQWLLAWVIPVTVCLDMVAQISLTESMGSIGKLYSKYSRQVQKLELEIDERGM